MRFRWVSLVVGVIGLSVVLGSFWEVRPSVTWTDRRPIGALFLASNFHSSSTNPRGWFNNPELDVRGAAGVDRFHKALLAYADRSIAILERTKSQGMIVWDLEGEQYPHKTTYIGDPRLVAQLAPETAGVLDEFFDRFRAAGFAVGMTVRPQQLSFTAGGHVSQTQIDDYENLLLDKIDYARKRWGATLFYIDSNGGPRWPGEVFRLQRLARQRPDILLIPEHSYPLYYAFSAPYGAMQRGDSPTNSVMHFFYPKSFQVLNIADFGRNREKIEAASRNGDVLLFPAWFETPASQLLENLANQ